MSGISKDDLVELRNFLEGMLYDEEINEAGMAEVDLSVGEVRWILEQLYFALRNDDLDGE